MRNEPSVYIISIPVTVVPAGTMRLPGPEAHPAEVRLAVLVLAHHVVAAAVLGGSGKCTLFAPLKDSERKVNKIQYCILV